MKAFLQPHRIVLLLIAIGLVVVCASFMRWDWLANPKYQVLLVQGIWRSI